MGNHYVNNEDFLAAIVQYKADVKDAEESGSPKPRVPEYVGECLLKIATKTATSFRFNQYTYKDEMILDGIENCLLYFDNFDPEIVSISVEEKFDPACLVDMQIVGPTAAPALVVAGKANNPEKNTKTCLYLKCPDLPKDPSVYVYRVGDTLTCHKKELTIASVRPSNPFGYYSQVIHWAFVRRINKERKQMVVKGKILQQLPYDVYDLQNHDEDGHGVVDAYLEISRHSPAFNDAVAKDEVRQKAKNKRRKKKDAEPIIFDVVDEESIEEIIHEIEND